MTKAQRTKELRELVKKQKQLISLAKKMPLLTIKSSDGRVNICLNYLRSINAEMPHLLKSLIRETNSFLTQKPIATLKEKKVVSRSGTKTTYKRPKFDIRVRGTYLFVTGKDSYIFNVTQFEREGENTDSLEIDSELRPELGSIIIKNSSWNNLDKQKTIVAESYYGKRKGKLTRIANDFINNPTKNGNPIGPGLSEKRKTIIKKR